MVEEKAPASTAAPEGTWHPLEWRNAREAWKVGEFMGSLVGVRPARPVPFAALWLSSTEVAPGETLQVRVRLHPSGPLRLRDFSVMLVGEAPPPRFLKYVVASGGVRHSELVMMHTNQVLQGGEVLELPLERVTLPHGGTAGNPGMRWYLKVEARLENQEELFRQDIDLHMRPWLQAIEPETQDPLPPLPELQVEEKQLPTTRSPVSEDIRRQLEGGIETLEAARDRYELLEKALRRKQWQQAVLGRPNTLRTLVRQEPGVDEALSRLHQRARVEGWPETEPALVLAREVERLRPGLETLMGQRLVMLAVQEGQLAEKLAHLDQLLAQTRAPPVSTEETVLHQGAFLPPGKGPPLLLMIGALIGLASQLDAFSLLEACFLVMGWSLLTPFVCVLREKFQRRRSGQFWLTGKRLVWQPTGSEPIHIPLHAIPPGDVRLHSTRSVEVRLVDGRSFRLNYIQGAERLVTLLEQHSPAALPDVPRELVH